MNRLTYDMCLNGEHCWQIRGADNMLCEDICKKQNDKGCKDCPIANAFNKLAEYENSGLEPHEIKNKCSENKK